MPSTVLHTTGWSPAVQLGIGISTAHPGPLRVTGSRPRLDLCQYLELPVRSKMRKLRHQCWRRKQNSSLYGRGRDGEQVIDDFSSSAPELHELLIRLQNGTGVALS